MPWPGAEATSPSRMVPQWGQTNMRVEEERAAIAEGAEEHPFFQLVYNERCAPAAEWFGERGWTAVATLLNDYLEAVGRPVPGPESEAGPMFARNTLVSAARV